MGLWDKYDTLDDPMLRTILILYWNSKYISLLIKPLQFEFLQYTYMMGCSHQIKLWQIRTGRVGLQS